MMRQPVITIVAFVFLATGCLMPVRLEASPLEASVIVVGRAGATYPIAEQDAMTELMRKVWQIDWKRQFSDIKQSVQAFRPQDLARLPRAKHDRTFMVDPTYTLSFDITDGKGGILYPKGYTFNPLDYVSLPDIIVFIDGSDKKQLQWFQKSPYAKAPNVMLLLTGGSYPEVEKKLQRPAFYAPEKMTKSFRIEVVPSILYQKGKFLEVKEFEIKNSK